MNSKQHRSDQESTVTSKSSGLSPVKASLNPSQGPVDPRAKVTKNDKKG